MGKKIFIQISSLTGIIVLIVVAMMAMSFILRKHGELEVLVANVSEFKIHKNRAGIQPKEKFLMKDVQEEFEENLAQLETEPTSEVLSESEFDPCADIECPPCEYCENGYCVNLCQGTDDSCGCNVCIDCDSSNYWANIGPSFSCCNKGEKCTCQKQLYNEYYCAGTSCEYLSTDTRIVTSNCSSCDAEQYCLGGVCRDYCQPPDPIPPPSLSDLSSLICCSDVYDCSDFNNRAEAQEVFDFCEGINNDIHQLDEDKDGIACEGPLELRY